MELSLKDYPHIEFSRKAINKRAKETKDIIARLKLLSKHPDGEHRLYIDETTNEYWQYASAWNFGAKPYVFLVPEISIDEWSDDRYVDPDDLLIYVASIEQFFSHPANREIPEIERHIRSLQKIGNMPEDPEGRWFGPYIKENIMLDFDDFV